MDSAGSKGIAALTKETIRKKLIVGIELFLKHAREAKAHDLVYSWCCLLASVRKEACPNKLFGMYQTFREVVASGFPEGEDIPLELKDTSFTVETDKGMRKFNSLEELKDWHNKGQP